jgi:hypothetical protein
VSVHLRLLWLRPLVHLAVSASVTAAPAQAVPRSQMPLAAALRQ